MRLPSRSSRRPAVRTGSQRFGSTFFTASRYACCSDVSGAFVFTYSENQSVFSIQNRCTNSSKLAAHIATSESRPT